MGQSLKFKQKPAKCKRYATLPYVPLFDNGPASSYCKVDLYLSRSHGPISALSLPLNIPSFQYQPLKGRSHPFPSPC